VGRLPRWLFAPDGRCGRVDFFYALLARMFALALPFGLMSVTVVYINEVRLSLGWMHAAPPLLLLAFLLSIGGPVVRRLHDLDLSGLHAPWLGLALVLGSALSDHLTYAEHASADAHWTLRYPATETDSVLALVAAIPQLLVFGLMLWPGTKGPNCYGPQPPAK